MSNSYRIRTDVGKDKSIKVLLDQDFEFLEILSLKILQSQIYTRPCADYGVVVGRVSVNNGFGLPNVKVSVFIPIDQLDSENEVKSTLYPYSNPNDLNEDGYRYNLLPYKQQHGGHTPTGTFFTREDVLTEPVLYEIFDKYYKYTARTNDSGDYMIFGVPVGPQTLHIDVDLSDIGEFSLSPQDLVRMGRANESQVAGTKFKNSTNLNELPQIVSINKTIEIEPLWGQPDLCTLGITRTDFDLTEGLNIKIEPTAIFMGSLISNKDDFSQKRNCKPKNKLGQLCSLTTGPGEIIAIRQTIRQDVQGRPGLEVFDLDSGGQVIDDSGTWLLDVPMNLDYVLTNEFGEQVLSDDPNKGIPTKGKYRFKVKWNQPPTMRGPVKRGYFLVPNIKENGWTNTSTPPPYNILKKSYAFSLDWNDYYDPQAAINCEDSFYMMQYNKVYTVAQHITQYRKGFQRPKYISIKNILDDSCESENLRFPTNDAQYRNDFIYILFRIAMIIFRPIIRVLLIILHVLAWFLKFIGKILAEIILFFCKAWSKICNTLQDVINKINNFFGTSFGGPAPCPSNQDCTEKAQQLENLWKKLAFITLPNLTYPDCEMCNCKESTGGGGFDPATSPGAATQSLNPAGSSNLSQFYLSDNYKPLSSPLPTTIFSQGSPDLSAIGAVMAGQKNGLNYGNNAPSIRVPQPQVYELGSSNNNMFLFTSSLNLAERINLFNTKAKFFDNLGNNPGGGVNQIKATFNYPINGTNFHWDNMLVMSCQASTLSQFPAGQLITFQDPSLSKDVNITGFTSFNQFGIPTITGTSIGTVVSSTVTRSVNVSSANPNGTGNIVTTYTISGNTADSSCLKFPIDLEYFQVITAMTINNYLTVSSPTPFIDSFKERFLTKTMRFYYVDDNKEFYNNSLYYSPLTQFNNYGSEVLVFLVRGVDPHTSRQPCKYQLGKLFGFTNWSAINVTGDYKLNVPIQGTYRPVNHSTLGGSAVANDTYSGLKLFYESYQFQPALTGQASFTGFTTDMPNFYSSLGDVSGVGCSYNSNAPLTGPISAVLNCPQPSQGLNLRTQNPPLGLLTGGPALPFVNGFNVEWNTPSFKQSCESLGPPLVQTYVPLNNSNTTNINNSGYYANEVVEGGSFMSQYVGLKDFPPGNFSAPSSCIYKVDFRGFYYCPYYVTSANLTFTTGNIGSNNRQIVMRTDRLPTSTTTQILDGSSFPLMQNSNFAIFNLDDNGTSSQNGGGNVNNTQNPQDDVPAYAQLFNSFTCDGLVPLGCYSVDAQGNPQIKPSSDSCYYNGLSGTEQHVIMQNGCYVLVTFPLKTLDRDLRLLNEWFARLSVVFGACRNVWSHLFTNNWINGTLFAFPINNDRFFTSPNTSPTNPVTIDGITYTKPNFPYTKYCSDTTFLDVQTNNFYYRSCPYSISTNYFIGAPPPPTLVSISPNYGGNKRNMLFPTTMVDLGPRDIYLQELVMSDKYDGYVVNKLDSTTFNDVDDLLNLLIINRFTNSRFGVFITNNPNQNILRFFSRDQSGLAVINYRMSDGDYSQAISINSELGVKSFDPANYTQLGQIFFNGGDSNDAIFGVQFSSDTQVRDWITPKRTIINPNLPITNQCAFNYFGDYSQEVPFYNWTIRQNTSTNSGLPNPNSIWGSQYNEWYTIEDTKPGGGFMSSPYQSMDRLSSISRYFRVNTNSQTQFFKGYIYGVDNAGNLSPSITNWQPNSPIADAVTVGAPFHFYFGLKQGNSAWDRFARKWVGFESIEI